MMQLQKLKEFNNRKFYLVRFLCNNVFCFNTYFYPVILENPLKFIKGEY